MKPLFAALSLAFAAALSSGCAPLDLSVFVEGASFLDESCNSTGDTQLIRGSLDVGPHIALNSRPRYVGHFGLRSDLQPLETKSGDDVLAGTSRNEFVANSVILNYTLSTGAGVPGATEPIYFVVEPGTTDNFIQFNMLNADAAQAIGGGVAAGGEAQLLISFQFQGNVRSSTNALIPMHTQTVVFPIRVTNTPTTLPPCTAPAVPVINGPCGNSQEAYVVGCSS
jgi:hypothetical protein